METSGLWLHDDAVIPLNHGSFGATPRAVFDKQTALRRSIEGDAFTFLVDDLEAKLDAVRAFVAPRFGIPARGLALVPNPTFAVNSVLAAIPFRDGDEIVFTNHGYNACNNAVRRWAERSGARAVVAHVPFPVDDPGRVTEAVLAAFTSKTRLLLIDHVTSPSGLVFPLQEIVDAAHARGAEVLVDGAHAPGMLPLDVQAIGAEWYTGAFHKWLCAPKGASFLYTRDDKIAATRPVTTSHGANAQRTDRSRYALEFDWTGTIDPTAYLCVPDAIAFVESLHPEGLAGVMRENRALALAGRERLAAALGVAPPCPPSMIGSLASLELPEGAADPLRRAIRGRHHIQAPVYPFPEPPKRVVRVSAHRYNTLAQYDALALALRAELGPQRS